MFTKSSLINRIDGWVYGNQTAVRKLMVLALHDLFDMFDFWLAEHGGSGYGAGCWLTLRPLRIPRLVCQPAEARFAMQGRF